jgi:hypothetical protein
MQNIYGEFDYEINLRRENEDRHRADITCDRLVIDAK